MLKTLIVALALTGVVFAQGGCVCQDVANPEDWYTVYDGGGCAGPGNPFCPQTNPYYVTTNWTCYNWNGSEYPIECQLVYCNGICDASNLTPWKPKDLVPASMKPSEWQFDPVKVVMNLWARYKVDVVPTGPHGSCVRVKVVMKKGVRI